MSPSLSQIHAAMDRKGFAVFNDLRGYDLNLIGIRSADLDSNRFNDWLTVSYLSADATWCYFAFPATTDPGLYYRQHPMNVAGTAIMLPGQYRGAYRIGWHKSYTALRQARPIRFARDANRDAKLDVDSSVVVEEVIAANIHRASAQLASKNVDRWSAGCQVIADPWHFSFLMALCRESAKLHGDRFSYTLLDAAELA